MNLPDLLRNLARDFLAYCLSYLYLCLFCLALFLCAQPFLWLGFPDPFALFLSFLISGSLFFRS